MVLMKSFYELEEYALVKDVPIMQKEGIEYLIDELNKRNAESVLEIGSAIGYSSLMMATHVKGLHVDTIERDEQRVKEAEENIVKAEVKDKINIYAGDAVEVLPTLNEKYDVVFIDAAKGKYPFFLKEALRMIKPEGIIFADNILYKGYVMSDYNKHKQRTAVRNLREYIKEVSENPNLETEILEVGDGLAVSIIKY